MRRLPDESVSGTPLGPDVRERTGVGCDAENHVCAKSSNKECVDRGEIHCVGDDVLVLLYGCSELVTKI